MGMSISDEELDKLGNFYVNRNISSRYGIPFDLFIEMMQDTVQRWVYGYDQTIRKELG